MSLSIENRNHGVQESIDFSSEDKRWMNWHWWRTSLKPRKCFFQFLNDSPYYEKSRSYTKRGLIEFLVCSSSVFFLWLILPRLFYKYQVHSLCFHHSLKLMTEYQIRDFDIIHRFKYLFTLMLLKQLLQD